MRYYIFSLREDINFHKYHINIALILVFLRPENQELNLTTYLEK